MAAPTVRCIFNCSRPNIFSPNRRLSVFASSIWVRPACLKNRRENSTLATEFKKATAGSNKRPLFWTSESDPVNHSTRHEGFYYTISPEHFSRWMRLGLCEHFYKSANAFQESCIMVRKPATEVIQCMKISNYATPVVRYVIYGRPGCGKSTSLAHVMHFCGTQGWIVAHVPWAAAYNRYSKEQQPSTYCPGRIDQPLEAAEWLANFRKTNDPLLKSLNLRATNEYVWSKRETAEVGTPLVDVIEFGLSRTKYAADVMGAILKELRLAAGRKEIKVLVAVDGVNAFWSSTSIKQEENRSKKHVAGDLTLVHHWKRILRNDWSGGAVVCTVDGNATQPADNNFYRPVELFNKDGFETLDPYVPVQVNNYSDKEAYSCIEYFIDRKWIQNEVAQTEEGQKELLTLAGHNPLQLYSVSVHW